MKNKGLSVVIGYVLLVTFGIVLSVVVYGYLKTYVPSEIDECPSGVSVSVADYDYDCVSNELNLTLKNNGLFNVNGYYIYATNNSEAVLATKSIAENFNNASSEDGVSINGVVYFSLAITDDFEPLETRMQIFDLDERVYSIEIVPARFQTDDGIQKFVGCGESSIEEVLVCS